MNMNYGAHMIKNRVIFRAQFGGPASESSNQKTILSGENRAIFIQIMIISAVKFHIEISQKLKYMF